MGTRAASAISAGLRRVIGGTPVIWEEQVPATCSRDQIFRIANDIRGSPYVPANSNGINSQPWSRHMADFAAAGSL